MHGTEWQTDEVNFLINAYNTGATYSAIAKALGRRLASITYKVKELTATGRIVNKGSGKRGSNKDLYFKPIEQEKFTSYLEVKGDVICMSDVHTPFWSKDILKYALAIAKKFKVSKLILNGDWLNLDSFSRWTTGFRGRKNTEIELLSASYYLIQCLKVFDRIYITSGNHEDRLLKMMEGQLEQHTFFKMITNDERVTVSPYPFCTVNGTWKVVHPKNYGDRGGHVPTDLADKYDSNIISGHNHQWGVQASRNGRFVGADQGMAGDPEKIEYHQKNITKNRAWQQGFSMIYRNHLYLFNLKFTDWDFWLKRIKV